MFNTVTLTIVFLAFLLFTIIHMFQNMNTQKHYSILFPLIAFGNIFYLLTSANAHYTTEFANILYIILSAISVGIMQVSIKHPVDESFKTLTHIFYNLIMLFILFFSLITNSIFAFAVSLVYLIQSIVMISTEDNALEKYLHILKIWITSHFLLLLCEDILNVNIAYSNILLLLTCTLYILSKMKMIAENNNTYFLAAIFCVVMYIPFNLYNSITAITILNALVVLLLLIDGFKKNTYTYLLNITLGFSLLSLITNIYDTSNFGISFNIIAICLAIIFICMLGKRKQLIGINILFILTYVSILLSNLNIYPTANIIAFNIIGSLIILTISRLICNQPIVVFEGIFLTILNIFALSNSYSSIIIYLSILSIIYIILGYKKISSLFYTGIITLILTCIIQFGEFFKSIPLPLYFFLIGIGIIGYVTYRQLSIQDNSNKQVSTNQDKIEK